MDKLTVFRNRLKKIGIETEYAANYPWIYITHINGKRVVERFEANHGWTIGYQNKEFTFSDIKEIFKLIRKYGTEV